MDIIQINSLIPLLGALANFAKDIHYTCSGDSAFAKHLLADKVFDDLYDFIDDLKENALLGSGVTPLPSKLYTTATALATPDVLPTDTLNFYQLLALINAIRNHLTAMEVKGRGINALLDNIAEHLDKCAGLVFLQIKGTMVAVVTHESKNYTKEECEGCVQRAVDRAIAKIKEYDRDKVAKTVLRQEAENVMVAEEETTLDKLASRLGV